MTWTARAAWAVPAAVVVLVAGVALAVGTGLVVLAVIAVLIAVVFVHFRRITVTVDESDLRVAFALPLFRVTVPLAEIERLEHVPDLRPVRYGGWGYRGSLRLFKKAAVILRRGDGVIFALTGDRRFIITIDEAGSLARTVQERIAG